MERGRRSTTIAASKPSPTCSRASAPSTTGRSSNAAPRFAPAIRYSFRRTCLTRRATRAGRPARGSSSIPRAAIRKGSSSCRSSMPRSRDPSHNRGSVPTLLRRLARAAAVLAALLLIALAVLHLPWVRGRVLDRARGYAERELGLALRSSGLGYNLLTRSIELRDLSVASTSAAEPFLEADRVAVVLGPEIFRGRINVHRISLDRPRLTIVRFADGTVNLPASRESTGQPAPLQLGIVSA